MKAVILTAGEGTRLQPLTVSRPKGLLPVANRPILAHVVDALRQSGIRDLIMVVGYRKEKVMSQFGDGSDLGVKIEYVVQRSPTGTAHALYQANGRLDGEFILVPGDNIISAQGVQRLQEAADCDMAILFTRSQTPSKYGVLDLKGDRVVGVVEKPKLIGDLTTAGIPSIMSLAMWEEREKTLSDLISTGVYKMRPEVFKLIEELQEDGESKLTRVMEIMLERKKVIKAVETDAWADAVYPWDLLRVNAMALASVKTGRAGTVQEAVHLMGPVGVGEDTLLRSGTYVEGPVVIGSNCAIGPTTHITGATAIGDNVTVGPFTTIQNSVIMDDVQIGSGCSIVNTVIAPGVRIGANFCVQKGGATVHLSGERPVNVRDIGAIIGEDTVIGPNVVATAGTIVGANCSVHALRIIRENLPNGSRVV